jgi:hypothetical protein
MGVFSAKQEKAIRYRIQKELESSNKYWQQEVLAKFLLCPYCGEIGSTRGDIEEMVEEQFHHFLNKCARWGNWQGNLMTLNELRDIAYTLEIKHRLVNEPLWHFFDQAGNWYCPACAKPVSTSFHRFKKLDMPSIKTIQEHCVTSCAKAYQNRPATEWLDIKFLKRTVAIANAAIQLVPEIRSLIKTDKDWIKAKEEDGTWICPFCVENLKKIDISTPFNQLERAPEMAMHLVTRYKKFKSCKFQVGQVGQISTTSLQLSPEIENKRESIPISSSELPTFLKASPASTKDSLPDSSQNPTLPFLVPGVQPSLLDSPPPLNPLPEHVQDTFRSTTEKENEPLASPLPSPQTPFYYPPPGFYPPPYYPPPYPAYYGYYYPSEEELAQIPFFNLKPGTKAMEEYLPDWMNPLKPLEPTLPSQYSSDLHQVFKDSVIAEALEEKEEENIIKILNNELFLESTFHLTPLPAPTQKLPQGSPSPNPVIQRVRQLLQSDPKLIEAIQEALPETPEDLPFEFKVLFSPSPQVNGDFYNVFQLNPSQFVFTLSSLSFTGKKSVDFNKKVNELLHKSLIPQNLVQSLCRINTAVSKHLGASDFFSVFLGLLDLNTWKIRFSNAGHNSLLIYDTSTASIRTVSTTGIVMGGSQASLFQTVLTEEEVQLYSNSILIQYSNGLLEQKNPQGQSWGFRRFYALLEKHCAHGIDALLEALQTELKNFTESQPQKEDRLLFAIRLTLKDSL